MKTYRIYYSSGVNWTCEAKSLRRAMWIATRYQSLQCSRHGSIEIYEYTADGKLEFVPVARKEPMGITWKKYKQPTKTTKEA